MPRINIPPKLLIIARSGRLPAQLALTCGYAPVVIDCYADQDTRDMALQALQVASLRLVDIQPAIEAMRLAHGLTHLVYGSGFESCPETLAYLEQDWVLLGNTAAVFSRLLDKQGFFQQLSALGILVPETVFTPPAVGDDWLRKPVRGQGGVGIRRGAQLAAESTEDFYWQRHLAGESLSVSFIAHAGQVTVLGFNRQWALALDESQVFVFAGIANCAELSETNQNLLRQCLAQLVTIYGLQGLGSLDFILKDGCCYVLEINARIPASAQLYAGAVFASHLQACVGLWGGVIGLQFAPAAYEIIYARNAMRIATDCKWPVWALDRPASGAFIGKGQPICSIIAAGNSPRQAAEQLLQRRQFIEYILNTGS
jgi:methenyltetrahydromethanopterin cyclohydrolase